MLEQVGRTVAPVPVLATTVLGAAPIAEFGTPEQIADHVAPAIAGEKILTAALTERLNPDPTHPTTTAVKDGADWVLTGTKVCVPAGPLADLVLVPADTGVGVGVFLVDPEGPGVTMTRQQTTNKDAEGLLEMNGAPAVDVLGEIGHGEHITQWILERGTVGLCAQQLGVLGKALEMTAEYTKTRVQFDRPIATFQAVGQRMADGYIDVEGVRLTTWQAAWRLSEGLPAATEVEVAKFWAAEAGHRVAHTAVHLHGGMGVDVDYPLHRYFIAAKQIEFTLRGRHRPCRAPSPPPAAATARPSRARTRPGAPPAQPGAISASHPATRPPEPTRESATPTLGPARRCRAATGLAGAEASPLAAARFSRTAQAPGAGVPDGRRPRSRPQLRVGSARPRRQQIWLPTWWVQSATPGSDDVRAVMRAVVSWGWRSMARHARRNTSTSRSAADSPRGGSWPRRWRRASVHSCMAAASTWSLDEK